MCPAGLCSLCAVPLTAAPSFKGHQFSAKYVPFSIVQSRQASQEEYNLDEVVYRRVKQMLLQSSCTVCSGTCQGAHELEEVLPPAACMSAQHCLGKGAASTKGLCQHARTGPQLAHSLSCQELPVPAKPCTTPSECSLLCCQRASGSFPCFPLKVCAGLLGNGRRLLGSACSHHRKHLTPYVPALQCPSCDPYIEHQMLGIFLQWQPLAGNRQGSFIC